MFPYTGSIQALAAKNAYEENELKVGGFGFLTLFLLHLEERNSNFFVNIRL